MTKIEYIGGCRELPSGERLRCGSGRTVSVESTDVEELSRSLSDRLSGRARLILESEVAWEFWKNEEADDLSERRLDFLVNAALVKEWSELPDESDRAGESRDRSEAERLGAGDLIDSLRSDETLETRVSCALAAI
jgi:hypothetical protein